MIINQQPPSSGGGGGAGEWTDISSAVGSDDSPITPFVCETDGQCVHVAVVVHNHRGQSMYIAGYPPKEDFTANVYNMDTGTPVLAGTMDVSRFENWAGQNSALFYPNANGVMSIIYPIAT